MGIRRFSSLLEVEIPIPVGRNHNFLLKPVKKPEDLSSCVVVKGMSNCTFFTIKEPLEVAKICFRLIIISSFPGVMAKIALKIYS